MHRYILKRLFLMIPVWIGVSLMTASLIRLAPGDVILQRLGEESWATPEQLEGMMQELGLDKPFPEQYILWIWNAFHGDLGNSLYTDKPVMGEILRRLPVSFELATLAMAVAVLLGIPAGVISAVRQDTPLDYVVRIFSISGLSVPHFFIGTCLLVFPALWFRWIPPVTYVPFLDNPVRNMVQYLFPALSVGIGISASIMRLTRSSMLEVLRQDYVRTAWAKGLRERVVISRHALKNALIPVVTVMGTRLSALIGGGLVIIEFVFNLPGVGTLLLASIQTRDYTLLQGSVLFMGTIFVLMNLIVDILYAWLDPRIRYD